jgi:hypothetical protein
MKKSFFILIFLGAYFFGASAQGNQTFTSVPVVNGRVVFEQFIHTGEALSADQKYATLTAWGKTRFTDNPMLSGMRFDDNTRTMTVGLRSDLPLSSGGTITMIYRFDVSVSNVGCMVVIRDITYQREPSGGTSIFPTIYTAEQTITDQAIAVNDDNRTFRNNTRVATLAFFNELFAEIEALFR